MADISMSVPAEVSSSRKHGERAWKVAETYGALWERATKIAEETGNLEGLDNLVDDVALVAETDPRERAWGQTLIRTFITREKRSLARDSREEHRIILEEARDVREQEREAREEEARKDKERKDAAEARRKVIAARPKPVPYFQTQPSRSLLTESGPRPRSQAVPRTYNFAGLRQGSNTSTLQQKLMQPTPIGALSRQGSHPTTAPTFLTRGRTTVSQEIPVSLEPGEEIVEEAPQVLFWIGNAQGAEFGVPGSIYITRTRAGTYRFVGVGERTGQQRSKMIGNDVSNAEEVALKIKGRQWRSQ